MKGIGMDRDRHVYVEQRIANDRKSAIVAYALWFFFGFFGAHRFYLGRWPSGLAMLFLLGIGTLTAPILIGYVPLGVLAIWWVIDLILIASMIRRDVEGMRASYGPQGHGYR